MKFLSMVMILILTVGFIQDGYENNAFAKESKKTKKIKKYKKSKKKKYRWVRASNKVNRYIDGDKVKLESMVKDLHE